MRILECQWYIGISVTGSDEPLAQVLDIWRRAKKIILTINCHINTRAFIASYYVHIKVSNSIQATVAFLTGTWVSKSR